MYSIMFMKTEMYNRSFHNLRTAVWCNKVIFYHQTKQNSDWAHFEGHFITFSPSYCRLYIIIRPCLTPHLLIKPHVHSQTSMRTSVPGRSPGRYGIARSMWTYRQWTRTKPVGFVTNEQTKCDVFHNVNVVFTAVSVTFAFS